MALPRSRSGVGTVRPGMNRALRFFILEARQRARSSVMTADRPPPEKQYEG